MTDIFSGQKRSDIMSKVKSSGSKIESLVSRALWAEGFRYRKNSKRYFGKPDIVLPKYQTVIFVDSCFWHGCSRHFSLPETRKKFWRDKIDANKRRDAAVNKYYKKTGWRVIRIWEHWLKNKRSFEKIFRQIRS